MESLNECSLEAIVQALNYAPIFAGINPSEQRMLAEKCKLLNYPANEIVIEQGAIGDRLYLILHGEVFVCIKNSIGEWTRIKVLYARDVFGEIAILKKIPRTARIITRTACTFITINSHDFLDIYQHFPPKSRDNIQLVIKKRLDELKQYS